jgi:hypothetical protein
LPKLTESDSVAEPRPVRGYLRVAWFGARLSRMTCFGETRSCAIVALGWTGSRVVAISIAAAALLAGVNSSLAQQDIGAANIVLNQVKGSLTTGPVAIVQGDGVFRDEGVQTAADSSAKLVLRDNTNLSLGPNSSVKLDRFVYAGPEQAGTIAINLAKGAFRFASGNADKRAYTLTTPTAAIGVRGTIFYGNVTATLTTIVAEEGPVDICTRSATNKRCVSLANRNDRADITPTSIAKSVSTSDPTKTIFAGFCGQGDICKTTPFTRLAKADIQELLTTHAAAGLGLSTQVESLALSDPSLVGSLIDAAKNGNDSQQAAIGAGLAEAAQFLASTDPQAAALIQQQVAQSDLSPLTVAFTSVSNGTQTAALGGGGDGDSGGSGPVNFGSANGGGGSNGSSNPRPNSFAADNLFTGFPNGGVGGSGGGGSTTNATNSADPINP